MIAYGRVEIATRVVHKRVCAHGGVLDTVAVVARAQLTPTAVLSLAILLTECRITNSCVVEAGGVQVQGVPAKGAIGVACGIVEERISAKGTIDRCPWCCERVQKRQSLIFDADGVVKERINSGGRVEVARCVAKERLHAGGGIVVTD